MNKDDAENETENRFGFNGHNEKSDAFRHAFFNAMNTRDVGLVHTELFSNAHESEVPLILSLEKEMDLFNNSVGINIGKNESKFISDKNLSNLVFKSLNDGELKYLNPLDWIASPKYDDDGDGVQDCSNCLNGIIDSTKLTYTNM